MQINNQKTYSNKPNLGFSAIKVDPELGEAFKQAVDKHFYHLGQTSSEYGFDIAFKPAASKNSHFKVKLPDFIDDVVIVT